jgi:SAM-dependent methyltransferase
MAIVRLRSYSEAFRYNAAKVKLYEFAGRGDKLDRTTFVNARIVSRLSLDPADVVLDIGCGDGCLLQMAQRKVARAIGTVPTHEELDRLTKILPFAELPVGQVQNLPLESSLASKVVCNSVFLLLESEDEVEKGLREIVRVAKPGALIWVGEIPEADEFAYFGSYRGDSIPGLLWFLWRRHGARTLLGMCRRLLRSGLGGEDIVLHAYQHYYADPKHFLALAAGCGLTLVEYSRHQEAADAMGRPVDSKLRYDYLFTRAS